MRKFFIFLAIFYPFIILMGPRHRDPYIFSYIDNPIIESVLIILGLISIIYLWSEIIRYHNSRNDTTLKEYFNPPKTPTDKFIQKHIFGKNPIKRVLLFGLLFLIFIISLPILSYFFL